MATHSDLIRASYEAFRRGDLDGALSFFAPDIEWTHPDGMAEFGLGGTKKGHPQVRAFMARARTIFSEVRPMPREFLEDGNRVIVLGTHRFCAAQTGRSCTVEFVHSWVLADGKATHFTDFHDTTPIRGLLETEHDPDAKLRGLHDATLQGQAVQLAAELGIADLLSDGPRSVDDLATATSTHPSALYRLLRTLAGAGIFAEDQLGHFTQTPVSARLSSNHPRSVRALWHCGGIFSKAMAEAMHSVRTGAPAFPLVYGESLFAYLRHKPELGTVFGKAMADLSRPESAQVLAGYDFTRARWIVDVGGGMGTLLASILSATPNATGTIFDQPQLAEPARQYIESHGLAGRCSFVGGDFFEEVPAGADLYLLKLIIHDWSDELAIAILRNCRRAMSPGSRLLLAERVIPPGNGPHFGKTTDFVMLVVLGGRERTLNEYEALFTAAGLRLVGVSEAAPGGVDIIEAKPDKDA